MRFKLDENLPSQCAILLLENGFNTETVTLFSRIAY